MNTTQKPFDDINVRKAVIAGFDRNALRLTRGGEEIGPIATHWIPPGIPGHDESGGLEGFAEFDFMAKPEGDVALAAEYSQEGRLRQRQVRGHGAHPHDRDQRGSRVCRPLRRLRRSSRSSASS